MDKSIIALILLIPTLALAQTHTMPGSNVVPSGASLTIQSGATITAAGGSTVTGFGGAGGTPGGSNTQVQYNNSSAFGGITGATTDGTTLSLKNLTMVPTSGTDNSTMTFGANYNVPAIYLYDNGAAFRYGWGLRLSEMQFFAPTGAHFSWNKLGDFQASGTNELMRLDNTSGTLNVLSGYRLGGAEFPIASNGLVKRTAANTYSAAVAGTDYLAMSGGTLTGTLDVPQGTVTLPGLTHGAGTGTGIYTTGSGASAIYNITVNGALKMSLSTTVLSSGNYIRGTTGSISTPAFSFTAETNAGLYRAGAGDIRMAATGVDVQKWLTSGISDFTTGLTVGGAAGSRKILVGDGTKFAPSTETYAAPGAAGNYMMSDGTNWTSAAGAAVYANASAAGLTTCCTANTLIPGSTITIPAGSWKAAGQYHCVFDMTKTGAGTAAAVINVHMGTAGTTSDAIVGTITWVAGTAVIDTGFFDVYVTFKSVGSGTSAVIMSISRANKLVSGAAGIVSSGSGTAFAVAGSTSSGFNSTTQTKLSIGFNGGASFSGTNQFCQAEYKQ